MKPAIDETHDPDGTSWVESAAGHPEFPIQNLPLGVFSIGGDVPRPGARIGDEVLCLKGASEAGLLPSIEGLSDPTLNRLMGRPAAERRALRRALYALLSDGRRRAAVEPHLHSVGACEMHLPAAIGDFTDFYAGIHHATNVGRLLRPDNPLMPNYKWVPIAYHGRSSSIRPSGEPVVRPNGQLKPPGDGPPAMGPSRRLDCELELGVWVGPGNALGDPIPVGRAGDHIAGFCLLNDWSARDLQAWEYQPLGPFLAKNFHSTISTWVVTSEALAPFRVAQRPRPAGDPRPLSHLWDEDDQNFGALAVDLEVGLSTRAMRDARAPAHTLSRGTAANLYWTVAQLLAHHTSGGCNLRPGDLLGTGTISTPEPGGYGSLMEMSKGGSEPIRLPNGETRTFLEDGDELLVRAFARAPGRVSIGFGECRAVIEGARPMS